MRNEASTLSPELARACDAGRQISAPTVDQKRLDLRPFPWLAANWPGREGNPLHVSALYRFKERGVRGAKLRAVRVPGSGWCSCIQWVHEFIEASNAPIKHTRSAPQTRRSRRLLRDRLAGTVK